MRFSLSAMLIAVTATALLCVFLFVLPAALGTPLLVGLTLTSIPAWLIVQLFYGHGGVKAFALGASMASLGPWMWSICYLMPVMYVQNARETNAATGVKAACTFFWILAFVWGSAGFVFGHRWEGRHGSPTINGRGRAAFSHACCHAYPMAPTHACDVWLVLLLLAMAGLLVCLQFAPLTILDTLVVMSSLFPLVGINAYFSRGIPRVFFLGMLPAIFFLSGWGAVLMTLTLVNIMEHGGVREFFQQEADLRAIWSPTLLATLLGGSTAVVSGMTAVGVYLFLTPFRADRLRKQPPCWLLRSSLATLSLAAAATVIWMLPGEYSTIVCMCAAATAPSAVLVGLIYTRRRCRAFFLGAAASLPCCAWALVTRTNAGDLDAAPSMRMFVPGLAVLMVQAAVVAAVAYPDPQRSARKSRRRRAQGAGAAQQPKPE